jgi:PBSX family phage terminase large subunit
MQSRLSKLIAPSFYDLHDNIQNDLYDEYWLKGGRGSTKSTFISIEIILGLLKDQDANAVVTRRYQNELRDSVFGQFSWTIFKLGLEDKFRFMINPMQIICIPTGQKIVFRAADNPRKLKSINLGKGYIKYAFMEEVDQFSGIEEIRNILQSLFRGEGRKRISFFSFNPPKSSRSWVNQEVKISKLGKIVHHSDYRQIPPEWLGENFIKTAEHLQTVNENAYRHEYLGEEVGTGLEVFTNVKLRPITNEEIATFDQIRQGLDWGYAVDPLFFVRMHYNRKKRQLFIFHEIQGIGLSNRIFCDKAKAYSNLLTKADSSEPKSIDEIRSYGFKTIGAKKGPGSVESGIKFLQDMEQIVIDNVRCPHTAKEFINYALDKNRAGEIISKFPDENNHSIDAIRYALEDDMPRPQSQSLPAFVPGVGISGIRC